ncbi:hypothetical protein N9M86_03470 [Euryarchaeota archaeon]|nr:hypothetical protein [Euryarchaeota archaeon]MDA9829066.1 hypothetical protein [Candidatus Poseidoniaceae archaeon]MDA8690128.1 hypothetical protein [Euryarchaeota archaeon]MDA8700533.1 hypothetical protein [Euryarchaeota archaeon]MDB2593513.1 hypothetical protein [Euryarchaeota archaeon]
MGPWDTAPVQQEEEEIDMFAILGAVPPAQTVVATTNQAMASTIAHDPLAAFMDDDEEETLVADSMFDLHEEPAGMFELMSEDAPVHEPVLNEPVTQHSLSNEVITELLEVLVKKELHARAERGDDWLSALPAQARAEIESAKVIKEQEAYHLSLIIDMVGTGQVRPFATVLSTGDGALPVNPPSHLAQSWYPLYNALRELLLQAMDSLSKLNVVSGKAAV